MNCIKDYTLIGGTAISLQINSRLSEDLDFCRWSTNLKSDKPTVDWPQIEKELTEIGNISSKDILGFDHVNFVVDGVKLTFITKQKNLSPVTQSVHILNNIKVPDLEALGAMKIELMLRRNLWRDYYDIYSILQSGITIKELVSKASSYSGHKLKTRDMLNFLSNGKNYKKDKNFHLMNPVYDIDENGIEKFIKTKIIQEYPIE